MADSSRTKRGKPYEISSEEIAKAERIFLEGGGLIEMLLEQKNPERRFVAQEMKVIQHEIVDLSGL